ncbi:MAG: hypothetical protein AAFR52_03165 [Pseudomonadota bacterium]
MPDRPDSTAPRVAIAGLAVRGPGAEAALGERLAGPLGAALARHAGQGLTLATLRLRLAEGAGPAEIETAVARALGRSEGGRDA